jgi:predicted nuclease of predicted toxin-antitoxin system
VRLLIDASLSPKVAAALREAGLECVHVGDVGLLTAPDRVILDYAAANTLVIVSADSDFGELLAAARGATRPSVVLLRSADRLTSDQQAALSAANLPVVADDLEAGAIVTIAGPDAPITARRSRRLTPHGARAGELGPARVAAAMRAPSAVSGHELRHTEQVDLIRP